MTALRGIALIPDPETQDRLIEFRARCTDRIAGPALGRDENLPHVTLFQAPMEPFEGTGPLEQVADAVDVHQRDGVLCRFTDLELKAGVWLFANVTGPWLAATAALAVDGLARRVRRRDIDVSDPMCGHTDAERRSQARFGYRYVGDAFAPHVTLGLLPARGVPDRSIIDAFATEFAKDPVRFTEVVYYDAGEHGALAVRTHRVLLSS